MVAIERPRGPSRCAWFIGGLALLVKMNTKEKDKERMEAIDRMMALHAQMRDVDRREIASKSDIDLTIWQTSYTSDSPQFRLAEHEWQRRLVAEQITATMKAARGQAYIGLAGIVIGAILPLLGALFLRLLPP